MSISGSLMYKDKPILWILVADEYWFRCKDVCSPFQRELLKRIDSDFKKPCSELISGSTEKLSYVNELAMLELHLEDKAFKRFLLDALFELKSAPLKTRIDQLAASLSECEAERKPVKKKKEKDPKQREFDAIITDLKPLYAEATKWQQKANYATNPKLKAKYDYALRNAHTDLASYIDDLKDDNFFETFRDELKRYTPKFWTMYTGPSDEME
jgi:hypothetical protein